MSQAPAAVLRVVDETGAPVAGALVSVAWSTVPFPEIALVTDAKGEVLMPLARGRYRILAHAADGRQGSLEATVGEDGAGADLRLVLSAA
jgi:hypothetical protein